MLGLSQFRVSQFPTAISNNIKTKPIVDLSETSNLEIVMESLNFWEGTGVENYAYCVMRNHVHRVLRLYEKDENNETVYLIR